MTPEELGTIEYEAPSGEIVFSSMSYGTFRISIGSLIVLGVATTESGPFAEDVFIVFVTRSLEVYDVPYGAVGRAKLFHDLSSALGSEIRCDPEFRCDFSSKACWPREISGRPIFRYSAGFLTRWFGLGSVQRSLTSDVVALVRDR